MLLLHLTVAVLASLRVPGVASASAACCAATPILASCFGYHGNGGNNSATLRDCLDTCGASFTIDYVAGSDGVWTLEGLESGSKTFPFVAGLHLNVSNVRVTLARGVTLQALRGGYHGLHDVLVLMGGANTTGTALVGEGGIVTDPAVRCDTLVAAVELFAAKGLFPVDVCVSPIHGAKGNVEFFLCGTRFAPGERTDDELQSQVSVLSEKAATL